MRSLVYVLACVLMPLALGCGHPTTSPARSQPPLSEPKTAGELSSMQNAKPARSSEPAVPQTSGPMSVEARRVETSRNAMPIFEVHTVSQNYDFRLIMKAEFSSTSSDSRFICEKPAELQVFPKGDPKNAQHIDLPEVCVVLDSKRELLVNSADVDEYQGTLNAGDFNFDSREDFAVQTGNDGPYGGPTYGVFLSDVKGGFVLSKELSDLTHKSLGFFQVDASRKRLVTFTKSGCCYHMTEEHEVRNDKPVTVLRKIEDGTQDDFVLETEEQLINGKWNRKTRRRVPKE